MSLLIAFVVLSISVSFICSILEAALLSITPSYIAQQKLVRPVLYEKLKVLKDKIDAIRQLIDQTENLQSYLLKLEPMQKAGLNLHCILMFNCKHSNFSEDGIIAQLHKKIKNEAGLSAESYTLENWNNHLRDYHHKNAVGLIKKGKGNEHSLYYCWYWVYSYFFDSNTFARRRNNIDCFNFDRLIYNYYTYAKVKTSFS